MLYIRFTDFYAIAHNNEMDSNANWNLVNLFCANIQNDNITYLKNLNFKHYDVSDEEFNCMIYDKNKFNSFKLNLSYEDFYTNAVIKFVKKAYKKYSKNKIMFIFDDHIIETFGKDLYLSSINKSINNIQEENNVNIEYKFMHLKNFAFGEVLSMELGDGNCVYGLFTTKYLSYHFVEKENYYDGLIDKDLYNNSENHKKYPYKTYIIDNEIKKYNVKPIKYLTIVDFQAYKTYYYTYSIIKSKVELYDVNHIDIGFMNIIEWIYNKTDRSKPIGYKFKSLISNLTLLSNYDLNINNYDVKINSDVFYKNSPIKFITENLIKIKHEILRKHSLDKKVIYKYNIENVVELLIKDVELKQIPFNGHCHKIMEQVFYLNNYLSNNLRFRGNYMSDNMVDKNNGSKYYKIDAKLNEHGYNYECVLNEKFNEI